MQKVDSEFQQVANITPIKNIVLCKNESSAKHYLDYIYDHNIDVIVASMDGVYPKNKILKDQVDFKLKTDSKLNVILINADSINELKIRTDRILVLDDLFLSAWKPKPYRFKFSPQQVAFLISAFCKQQSYIKNETNVTEIFQNQKPSTVSDKETDWIKGLYS